MTIGQTIGKVQHAFSVTNDRGEDVKITVEFDFSTCTNQEIKSWLVANRTIALQRPLRALSADEIKSLNGTTIPARDCGRKIETPKQKLEIALAVLRQAGLLDEAEDLQKKINEMNN